MSGGSGSARGERIFIIMMLLALAITAGYSEFARQRGEREARDRDVALAEDIAAVREEAKAAFSALIPQDVVTRTNASVYAVVVNNRLQGTAFVIDRENGVLATAAHVAASLPLDEEGARVDLLNRFNGAPIRIVERQNHAGYGAFRELIEDFQPVRPQTPILRPQILPLRDLAFDAGLIMVDPIDPATGENRLGPDLPIAPEEQLLELSAGAPIAVIGFPYDTLDDSFAAESATSRVDRGVISAMIAPLDNAATASDPVVSNLIIHRLSTAGGNSGSPIINASGEVVGIHTHGIESPSGNADGAGQRADVLYDLLEQDRDARRLSETFIPAWTRTLGFWRSARDVLPWSFYLERKDPEGTGKKLVSEIDYAAPAPFAVDAKPLQFGDVLEEYIVNADDLTPGTQTPAAGDNEETLGLTTVEQTPVFKIENPGRFAEVQFTVDRSKNTVLFAFDYSLRRKNGFCPLTTYWRREGEARLAIQSARPASELYFEADRAVGDETYHLTFQRHRSCDPASMSFYAAMLSWAPDGEGGDQPALTQVFFAPSDHAQFETHETAGLMKILSNSRVRCFLPGAAKGERCGKPEYIDAEFPGDSPKRE